MINKFIIKNDSNTDMFHNFIMFLPWKKDRTNIILNFNSN
jgi:hypothetical protein